MRLIRTLLVSLIFNSYLFISCDKSCIEVNVTQDGIINPTSEYIVVIGDIQEYTSNDNLCKYYIKTLDWINAQNGYFNNIKAVVQVGDITWSNSQSQWERFYNATYCFAQNNFYLACIGNHDYSTNEQSLIEPPC